MTVRTHVQKPMIYIMRLFMLPFLYDSAMRSPQLPTQPVAPSAIDPVPLLFDFHTIPTMPIATCTTYHVHDRNLACLAQAVEKVSESGTVRPSNTPCVFKPDDIGIVFIILRDVVEDFVNTLFDRILHPLTDFPLRPCFVGLTQLQGCSQLAHIDNHFVRIVPPLFDAVICTIT